MTLKPKHTHRIAMAVTNDLVTDQRVLRHAEALAAKGQKVTLIGRRLAESGEVETRCRVVRMELRHRRGWRFYAEYNWRLFRLLRKEKPDLVWANDTDTLPGCWLAAKTMRRPLVLDAHELFPEVPEIQHKPLVRWVWRTIERLLMPQCDALLTVCDSIADHYRQNLGVQMTVVRNLQPSSLTPDPSPEKEGSEVMLLYQGKVNLGRGVDWAIDALEWLTDCRLVVAGDGDLLEKMNAYAASKPWSDRVTFTGRLMPEAMRELTRQADVGLVMLEDMGLSYHYALPNRIGDFVAAGVPMVVSDLPEMSQVVRKHRVGEVMREPGPKALAESVRWVLARKWHDGDFASARSDMDWEKEKEKLTNIIRSCKL